MSAGIFDLKLLILICIKVYVLASEDGKWDAAKLPTVIVAILIRNKAHSLPYFLTLLSQINYPKNRIGLWIRSDHNEDISEDVIHSWTEHFQAEYHFINASIDTSSTTYPNEKDIGHWTGARYKRVIALREEALIFARYAWADYVWFLDSDSFITNPAVLVELFKHDKTVVAPMLLSDSMYSNFWCGMTESYYYKRTEDYEQIYKKKKTGCFEVPMVHSATLVNLRKNDSDLLTYSPDKMENYDGPTDDIIAFAVGANKSNILLYICNNMNYGYTSVPLEENQSLEDDKNNLLNLKLFITVDEAPLPVHESVLSYASFPEKSNFGFDKIFVINLKRRRKRRDRMEYCLNELGIEATFIDAVDGQTLDDKKLSEFGITLLKNYEDPYHKRPMKKGEIGCFLSHYKIWKMILKHKYQKVLILEDDVRFEKFFISKLRKLEADINGPDLIWDLIYIGRKIMQPKNEQFVESIDNFVYPDYTYWTIGYILNEGGARKLIDAKPLKKLIPVDEFLPVMFDKHPRDDWKAHFVNRNLIALSVNPLIISPMKYTHEEGYISDTEDSHVLVDIPKNEL